MKLVFWIALSCSTLLIAFTCQKNEADFVQQQFSSANLHLQSMLKEMGNDVVFPRTTNDKGQLVTTNMYDWTPGFFPGSLWYAYEYTKDTAMRNEAIRWTEKLEPLKDFKDHHDLGFMMYCSYGNAYRLTGNPQYKNHLIQAAKSLCTRFDPKVGCIKSWNTFTSWHGNKVYTYPVIIDNLMNLELLFFATKATGDSSFYKTAIIHANNTLVNQFRDDFSSYHVVCYDANGNVQGRETAQGYADNSTWSRGHAWAIYGYTMIYRETGDKQYLNAAMKMADWYLSRLPEDKVPFWDFNIHQAGYIPGKNSFATKTSLDFKDASAAAITTSALFELSKYAGAEKGRHYSNEAISSLHSLASDAYFAKPGTNGNFLLKHSVGSIPHQTEIDKPLVYADYYFMEALHRYRQQLSTL